MTYKPIPTVEAGGQDRVVTINQDALEVLQAILIELRIMNQQLETLTGDTIKKQDLTED